MFLFMNVLDILETEMWLVSQIVFNRPSVSKLTAIVLKNVENIGWEGSEILKFFGVK